MVVAAAKGSTWWSRPTSFTGPSTSRCCWPRCGGSWRRAARRWWRSTGEGARASRPFSGQCEEEEQEEEGRETEAEERRKQRVARRPAEGQIRRRWVGRREANEKAAEKKDRKKKGGVAGFQQEVVRRMTAASFCVRCQ